MESTNVAITVLSVIDGTLLLLIPALDKRLYKRFSKEPVRLLFINMSYDSAFHRFIYSRLGTLLISVVFIGVIVLTKWYGRGNW